MKKILTGRLLTAVPSQHVRVAAAVAPFSRLKVPIIVAETRGNPPSRISKTRGTPPCRVAETGGNPSGRVAETAPGEARRGQVQAGGCVRADRGGAVCEDVAAD